MATRPKEIAPGVYWLKISIANVYFIRTPTGWALVDTALPRKAQTIREAADSLFGANAKPDAILLTHGHMDHCGSAEELARVWDLPVYLHPAELPFVEGKQTYPLPDPSVGGFMAFLSRFVPARRIDLHGVQRALDPGESVPGLPGWQAIHTPGHSPGHIAFFRESDRTLLAGDAFTTVNLDSLFDVIANRQQISRPPAPITCDWIAAKRSVHQLAGLNPAVLACGHGTPMSGPDTPARFREFARTFPVPLHGRYVSSPVTGAS